MNIMCLLHLHDKSPLSHVYCLASSPNFSFPFTSSGILVRISVWKQKACCLMKHPDRDPKEVDKLSVSKAHCLFPLDGFLLLTCPLFSLFFQSHLLPPCLWSVDKGFCCLLPKCWKAGASLARNTSASTSLSVRNNVVFKSITCLVACLCGSPRLCELSVCMRERAPVSAESLDEDYILSSSISAHFFATRWQSLRGCH